MKVTFEGTQDEIAKLVQAAFSSTQIQITPVSQPVEKTEEMPASLEAAMPSSESSEQPVLEPQQTIRSRVLSFISKYENVTIAEIAAALKLDFEQVRAPSRHLMNKGYLVIMVDPQKVPYVPHRMKITRSGSRALKTMMQAGRAPARRRTPNANPSIRSLVTEYLATNPASTSSQVAKALGVAPNRVSATLTVLSQNGVFTHSGGGGFGDPYRYSPA